jgi:hypothetical protein
MLEEQINQLKRLVETVDGELEAFSDSFAVATSGATRTGLARLVM